MNQPIPSPVRYSADLDRPEPDERENADALSETMQQIQEKTFEDEGRGLRSVHAKSHGLLRARMEVPEGLPRTLQQGVFAKPGKYDILMRFSTSPGDLMSDKVSTPRGLAIKILGVDGQRLEGSEDATTQDFLFVNGPTFNAPNAKVFLGNLKMLAATTDKAEGAKQGLSALLRATESVLEAMGGKSATLRSLGGEPPKHILGESYFTQLPQRFGEFIAKLRLAPLSPNLASLKDEKVDLGASDTILRDKVVEFFEQNEGVWELSAQLCTDLDDTPIDNPSKPWDETVSPFFGIARITAPQQLAWSDKREEVISDGLGFSPWHGLEDHRPMGAIMRIRKSVYERSQAFRSQRNPQPIVEPNAAEPRKSGETSARNR